MKKSRLQIKQVKTLIGSNRFFWAIVALLIFQAGWIALSGRYPMAFDEDFHLGVIKLYAHHPNPFWNGDVIGGDAFGAVARDPSYLYHYLMSFPYKVINRLSDMQTQLMMLRAVNIAFFAAGLVIYRKLLLKTKASPAIVNITLLLFILIPVTSLLAAQLNYDNAFIPLTGLALLATLKIVRLAKENSFDVATLLGLLALCMFTALIKYAFLPIFAVISIYLLVFLYMRYHNFNKLKSALKVGFTQLGRPALAGLILLNLSLGVLFVERYGVNLVRYHTPVADCAEVLNYDHCKNYGPWIRDYNFKTQKMHSDTNPIGFSYEWARGMWFRSFFAVAGPTAGFQTRGPLTMPGLGVIVFATLGIIAFGITRKEIWRKYDNPTLWLMLVVSIGYVAVLWIEEYRMYVETGRAVAINGRYLLPVLPLIILLSILGFKELTKANKKLQLVSALAVFICLIWGGGAATYVLRSNDQWYWPNNQFINSVNHNLQDTVGPLTPGYNHPTQYLR